MDPRFDLNTYRKKPRGSYATEPSSQPVTSKPQPKPQPSTSRSTVTPTSNSMAASQPTPSSAGLSMSTGGSDVGVGANGTGGMNKQLQNETPVFTGSTSHIFMRPFMPPRWNQKPTPIPEQREGGITYSKPEHFKPRRSTTDTIPESVNQMPPPVIWLPVITHVPEKTKASSSSSKGSTSTVKASTSSSKGSTLRASMSTSGKASISTSSTRRTRSSLLCQTDDSDKTSTHELALPSTCKSKATMHSAASASASTSKHTKTAADTGITACMKNRPDLPPLVENEENGEDKRLTFTFKWSGKSDLEAVNLSQKEVSQLEAKAQKFSELQSEIDLGLRGGAVKGREHRLAALKHSFPPLWRSKRASWDLDLSSGSDSSMALDFPNVPVSAPSQAEAEVKTKAKPSAAEEKEKETVVYAKQHSGLSGRSSVGGGGDLGREEEGGSKTNTGRKFSWLFDDHNLETLKDRPDRTQERQADGKFKAKAKAKLETAVAVPAPNKNHPDSQFAVGKGGVNPFARIQGNPFDQDRRAATNVDKHSFTRLQRDSTSARPSSSAPASVLPPAPAPVEVRKAYFSTARGGNPFALMSRKPSRASAVARVEPGLFLSSPASVEVTPFPLSIPAPTAPAVFASSAPVPVPVQATAAPVIAEKSKLPPARDPPNTSAVPAQESPRYTLRKRVVHATAAGTNAGGVATKSLPVEVVRDPAPANAVADIVDRDSEMDVDAYFKQVCMKTNSPAGSKANDTGGNENAKLAGGSKRKRAEEDPDQDDKGHHHQQRTLAIDDALTALKRQQESLAAEMRAKQAEISVQLEAQNRMFLQFEELQKEIFRKMEESVGRGGDVQSQTREDALVARLAVKLDGHFMRAGEMHRSEAKRQKKVEAQRLEVEAERSVERAGDVERFDKMMKSVEERRELEDARWGMVVQREDKRQEREKGLCRALEILASRVGDVGRDVGVALRVLGVAPMASTSVPVGGVNAGLGFGSESAPIAVDGGNSGASLSGDGEDGDGDSSFAAPGRKRRKLANGKAAAVGQSEIRPAHSALGSAATLTLGVGSSSGAGAKSVLERLESMELVQLDIQECLEKLKDPTADARRECSCEPGW